MKCEFNCYFKPVCPVDTALMAYETNEYYNKICDELFTQLKPNSEQCVIYKRLKRRTGALK